MLVASYHVVMGQAPMSHPFTLSQGAFSTEQVSAPVAPSSPVHLSIHPNPSGNTPPLTWWTSHLWVGPHPRQPPEGPPSSKQVRNATLTQGADMEPLRSIQLGHQSSEGDQGGVL